ncbi:N-dimethylarginine dimethylaminohydrolase [Saccharopolyspora lacisalsi]|uniref:N-dimethylarginine dimethylaminohydrolase n=1 Tax=Halosaccharopolyspora lacisalsi TaxID=1000566 RepID=A0A839E0P9_9PSEU|nr:arginine deiminase-related protein [Halosaccharopolyspora lacisalsi]MBA8825255.1 N-dimethylarginine dimethylaminohydrolase [Halosaccharopolyspora lacisalsi]
MSNPSQLKRPAFLLNAPFSYDTEVANNPWMVDLTQEDREPDPDRAMTQFMALYRFLAADSLVCVLPTPRTKGLQDLVFTANLGIVPEHLSDKNTVIVSNFTPESRRGETEVGVRFFESMGYHVYVPEHRFEGEADLKHLSGNVYIGGYGQRTEKKVYDWMEREFGMEVIRMRMTEPYLYHLDCSIFPLTTERTLVCTEAYRGGELRALEKRTEIIDVPKAVALPGLCNSVRLHNTIINASDILELRAGTDDYDRELAKNRTLEDVARRLGFDVALFNLDEYTKSGAMLSCLVMHLNRDSYAHDAR